jgi:predicted esterase
MFKPAIAFTLFVAISPAAFAQTKKKDPVPVKPPDEQTIDLIKHRTIKLEEALKALPAKTPEYIRSDVEIYHKAAEWIVRHNEWVTNDAGKWTLAVLDQGMQRAADAAQGKAPWREPAGKTVSFAYRSKIDGSVQPYAVTYPLEYGKDPKKKWRLDVVLHGRDGTICEVKFLYQHNGKAAAKDQDYVQLEVYGRGNNAYRWAGETDVFEAMEDFLATEKMLKRDLTDQSKTILRGFSMGGAGTWHLGLHHPDRFAVIQPGAGFTTTHGYIKDLPNPLPPYQEPLLHIYDAIDYVENAFNVPIIAYSGEKDGQRAAADNIENRLKELKINTMTHLIAPGLEHQFPAEWQKKAQAEIARVLPFTTRKPDQIRFATYTLKYGNCYWVEIVRMEKHYELARLDVDRKDGKVTVNTRNISAFRFDTENLDRNDKLTIDGQQINGNPLLNLFYTKKDGKWESFRIEQNPEPFQKFRFAKVKREGRTGPIDDAFTKSFICVRGSGQAWNPEMARAADAQLDRFVKEWDKWMRGKLLVKSDKDVHEINLQTQNLILFGDPGSNSLISKTMPNLPFSWSKQQIEFGSQKFDAAKNLPMLIYPSPHDTYEPQHYIVLNSGHTFHEADFKGTNALLYPRLGDYAVVRPLPTRQDPAAFEVMKAGIFDDSWKISEK